MIERTAGRDEVMGPAEITTIISIDHAATKAGIFKEDYSEHFLESEETVQHQLDHRSACRLSNGLSR